MTHAVLPNFLVIGLGNPGVKYAMTRHNLGFLVVQAFAAKKGWVLKQDRRFNALVAKGEAENRNVHLLLPLTFMNLSGISVKRYIDYYKISKDSLIVITDDIALNFGQLRLKLLGSAGGHNGLKSIGAYLGARYMRLRMGVGHPGEKMLADYVLESFNETEQKELNAFIDRGSEVLQRLLKESASSIMNSVNTVFSPDKTKQQQGKEIIDLTKPPLTG